MNALLDSWGGKHEPPAANSGASCPTAGGGKGSPFNLLAHPQHQHPCEGIVAALRSIGKLHIRMCPQISALFTLLKPRIAGLHRSLRRRRARFTTPTATLPSASGSPGSRSPFFTGEAACPGNLDDSITSLFIRIAFGRVRSSRRTSLPAEQRRCHQCQGGSYASDSSSSVM